MDSRIEYMQAYLQQVHQTKNVCLNYRAVEIGKAKADMVSKELTAKTIARRLEDRTNGRTAGQKARAVADDREERA